jgi:hypothetical protein
MSEPMSSGDIEDVLSSIRRLVSEELRPIARTTAGAKPAITDAEKLILTPALRIVPGPVAVEKAAQSAPEPQPPKPLEPLSLQDDVAAQSFGDDTTLVLSQSDATDDASAAWPGQEVEWDDAEDEWVPDEDEWIPEAEPQSSTFPKSAEAASQIAGSEYDDELDETADSPASPYLTRVVSAIGSAVDESASDWEPETGDASFAEMSWKAPEWVPEAEVVEEPSVSTNAQVLNDRAEAEAVAEILRGAAQQASKAPAPEAPKPEAPKPEADLFAEDEGYFDETVLRDLVRDLIREELSGTLGERITRNVRKLVRAEINRALTARDFD